MFRVFTTAFTAVLFFAVAFFAAPVAAQDSAQRTTEEIEQIVRNYLLENPEVIAEAVAILQERAQREQRARTKAALKKNRDLLENDPLSIVVGNPEGDVTLVEFYDYRCPYCRTTHGSVMRLIEEDKGLRVVLKQFPVKDKPGEVPVSLISARLAMAAEKQGLFLPFHHAMFVAEPPLTEHRVYEIAKEVGLDLSRLEADMKAPEITEHLRETLILASEIGATGTPAFVIGDVLIPGVVDYEILKQFVDYSREAKKAEADPQQGDW